MVGLEDPRDCRCTMRTYRILPGVLVLALLVTGCAALLRGDGRPSPEQIMDRALTALENGYYESAAEDLAWVSTYHTDRPTGRLSLLILSALELDPDSPVREPESGAERLENLLALEEAEPWLSPVTNALLGLSVELRKTEARAVAAERSARAAAQQAQRAEGQAEEAQSQRAALQSRISRLERELATSRHQTAAARQELARIRRALGG